MVPSEVRFAVARTPGCLTSRRMMTTEGCSLPEGDTPGFFPIWQKTTPGFLFKDDEPRQDLQARQDESVIDHPGFSGDDESY